MLGFDPTHTGFSCPDCVYPAEPKVLWQFEASAEIQASAVLGDAAPPGKRVSAAPRALLFSAADRHIFALDARTGKRVWSFEAGAQCLASPTLGGPGGGGGLLFQGCDDHVMYALDQASGALRWKLDAGGEFTAGGTYWASRGRNRTAHAAAAPGAVARLRGSSARRDEGGAGAAPLPDTLFVGCGKDEIGFLWALNPATGTKRWVFKSRGAVASTPALAADAATGRVFAFFGDDRGWFYKLDARTGEEVWALEAGGNNIRSPPAVYAAGDERLRGLPAAAAAAAVVMFATGNPDGPPPGAAGQQVGQQVGQVGEVWVVRASDGSLVWRAGCATPSDAPGEHKCDSCWTTPTAIGGVVVVGCGLDVIPRGVVWGLSLASGSVVWKRTFANDMQTSNPVALRDGSFLIGCADRHLYCLDASTGATRWAWKQPNSGQGIWATPAFGPHGTIFLGSKDGHMYALGNPEKHEL
jgi:outer membrane protein assembly factor BamB